MTSGGLPAEAGEIRVVTSSSFVPDRQQQDRSSGVGVAEADLRFRAYQLLPDHVPRMLSRGEGRVIFIASERGIMTPPELIDYGMTKSAQLAISRGTAELTKGTNVIQPRGRPRSL